MVGIIYMATSPSGKIYVGQTTNFKKRKLQHKVYSFNKKRRDFTSPVHNAIRKYGFSAMVWEIIAENVPVEHLDSQEIAWICWFDSYRNGLNATSGGSCGSRGPMSEECKNKISAGNTGKKRTPEMRKRYSKCKTGVIFSDKHKRNISKAKKGALAGEKHPMAKLTWDKVYEIIDLYKTGRYTKKDIDNMYNLYEGCTSRIIRNKVWVR